MILRVTSMRLLNERDLKLKGIKFSRQHRHRLVRRGLFPKPVKIGVRTNAWLANEIDEYVEKCIARREEAAAAPATNAPSANDRGTAA
jgi:prophage regulatory protein